MRAAGYIRLSKYDANTTSPQRQREAIARECERKGWTLAETFQDIDASGYNGKHRAGFEAMMERLGEFDAVVFLRLDRLARSLSQLLKIAKDCEEAGVQLVATDGDVDTSTASGRAFYQMRGVFAEFESALLSEKGKATTAYLREQGKWLGGPTPFGWTNEDGNLVPHPQQQAQLIEAARAYVAGEPVREIGERIGRHHPSVLRILTSERTHDALPDDLSEALARALLERRGRRSSPKSPLLSGIARCGTCGGPLVIVARKKNRGDWGSYGCRRERGHVHISEAWLDRHVSEQVVKAIDSGEVIKRIRAKQKARAGTPDSSAIEARLELLETDHYEGMLPRDRYLKRREALLRKLKEAREVESQRGIELPEAMARDLAENWERLTVSERRRIISAVVGRVTVAKAKNHGKIDPERVRIAWRT